MKDTQYFPGPPKSWNGGIMSGGGAPTEGRGAPWPQAHHQLPRPGHQLLSFLGAAPAAHHPWPPAAPKPPPTTSGIDLSSRPPAGIDLSTARSPLPNGALNGSSAPSNVPKESVSVIAPNPLRPPPPPDDNSMAVDDDEDDDEDEDCMVIDAPPQPPAAHSAPAAAGSFHPSRALHLPSFPLPPRPVLPSQSSSAPIPSPPSATATALPMTAPQLPLSAGHRQSPVMSSAPIHLPPMPIQLPPAPQPPSNHRPPSQTLDHVESLLENMFQQQEEPPIPHPVIVPNSLRPPLLTEDKVVAMLEEPGTPEKTSCSPSHVPSVTSPPSKNVSTTVPSFNQASTSPPVSSMPSSGLSPSVPKPVSQPAETTPGPPSKSSETPGPPTSSEVSSDQASPNQSNVTLSSSTQMTSTLPSSDSTAPSAPSLTSTVAPSVVDGLEQMLNATNKGTAEAPNTFLQVESELARMFAGIVEPSEEQTPLKPAIKEEPSPVPGSATGKTPARRRGRKPDRGRQRKTGGLVRERRITAPLPPKDGSSDGSLAGARARGPFLRISGDRLCPTSVVLVNAARDDEERDRPVDPTKRRHPKIVEGRVKGQGLYTSTLAAKYNSTSLDITWTCAFCHKRSHCSGGLGGEAAGDLFGPYTVTLRETEKVDGPSDVDVATAQRLHGSGGRGQSLRAANAVNSVQQSRHHHHHHHHKGGTEESEEGKEVWAHEQCIIWAPGVMMVGPHLVGLDDALSSSLRSKCTGCGEVGAGIGCLEHSCGAVVHYGCAVSAHWQLDEETFHAHCPLHRKIKVLTLEMLKSGT